MSVMLLKATDFTKG